MNTDDLIAMLLVIGFVVFICWMAWHPTNNDYVNRREYNTLYQNYIDLQKENEEVKRDLGLLLIESYGKPLVWDIVGLNRYRKGLCAIKILLQDEIPEVNLLPC
jgi:hypothetical protein